MKRRIPLLALALWLCASTGYAQQQENDLPQVANGQFSGGIFKTTFIAFNSGSIAANVTISLSRDDGSPLTVTITEFGTASSFTFTLGPGESRLLQTDGSGGLAVGAAKVISDKAIGVSAIFTLFKLDGSFLTEAGVGGVVPQIENIIPVDTTGNFNTGMALFNPAAAAATITLRLLDTSGQERARVVILLGANSHSAKFVAGELFPSIANLRGTLVVSSTAPIAVLTLRQNAAPLTFTTLPAVPRANSQMSFSLPQIANGIFAGGSFRTTLILFSTGAGPSTVTIALTRDDGSPFVVTITGRGTSSTFAVTLQPGESAFLQTDGSGLLTAGAARITATGPIGVAAIFTVFSPAGEFITEAGVGDSPARTEFTIPVDTTGKFNTGFALFNQTNVAVLLTLTPYDRTGQVAAPAKTITLPPGAHLAQFFAELFSTITNFRGTLAISAGGPISAVTLRQNADPLTFTTLPVGAGAFSPPSPPPPQPAPLLSRTIAGVSALDDQVLDATLPPGLRLSGTISGSVRSVLQVAARGSLFTGAVNPATNRYLIIVPPGTYTLTVCYEPSSAAAGQALLTYEDPQLVAMTADRVRDIVIPDVPMSMASGMFLGLNNSPGLTQPKLVFTSIENRVQGIIDVAPDSNFRGQLPSNNTYRVSLTAVREISPLQRQNVAIYNIAVLTVGSGQAFGNYSVPPPAQLQGRVVGLENYGGLALATVLAVDRSGELADPGAGCVVPPVATSLTSEPLSGGYSMLLAAGRNYFLSATIPILENTNVIGALSFPRPPQEITLSGDATSNINAPGPAVRVILRGRVIDAAGQPVKDVTVTATSSELSGLAALFTAFGTTESSGNYRLVLYAGSNYTVTFTPKTVAP
ncbi:MAG TPA: carboxypeptidase-like regulatory domain-containing protein [Acidobacteriota bacterium]|jgi:hypothetical protein